MSEQGWREFLRVPGMAGAGALLTVAGDRLRVRLARDVVRLELPDVELGRAVSATARAHGAVADRSAVHEVQSNAPVGWILADQAGNKVCVASWPDRGVP